MSLHAGLHAESTCYQRVSCYHCCVYHSVVFHSLYIAATQDSTNVVVAAAPHRSRGREFSTWMLCTGDGSFGWSGTLMTKTTWIGFGSPRGDSMGFPEGEKDASSLDRNGYMTPALSTRTVKTSETGWLIDWSLFSLLTFDSTAFTIKRQIMKTNQSISFNSLASCLINQFSTLETSPSFSSLSPYLNSLQFHLGCDIIQTPHATKCLTLAVWNTHLDSW